MSTSTSTGISSGGSSAAKSAGSRVGGSAPVATNASPARAQLSGSTDAAKQAGKAASHQSGEEKKQGQATPKGKAPNSRNEFAQTAEGMTQTLGLLSALAVPGMEGSQNLSLSPQSSPHTSSSTEASVGGTQEPVGPDTNVIRPTQDATSSQSLGSLYVPGMAPNGTTQPESES
jgi:type IV secretion system protein TrbL